MPGVSRRVTDCEWRVGIIPSSNPPCGSVRPRYTPLLNDLHVVSALRNKRAELAGMVGQLEQQLAQQRTNLAHLDPDIRLKEIRPKQQRVRSAWPSLGMASALRLAARRTPAGDDAGSRRADHERQGYTGDR
jgi:hypothetical protein